MQYKYEIKPLAIKKVRSFYRNVCLKYPNTYSYYDMLTTPIPLMGIQYQYMMHVMHKI